MNPHLNDVHLNDLNTALSWRLRDPRPALQNTICTVNQRSEFSRSEGNCIKKHLANQTQDGPKAIVCSVHGSEYACQSQASNHRNLGLASSCQPTAPQSGMRIRPPRSQKMMGPCGSNVRIQESKPTTPQQGSMLGILKNSPRRFWCHERICAIWFLRDRFASVTQCNCWMHLADDSIRVTRVAGSKCWVLLQSRLWLNYQDADFWESLAFAAQMVNAVTGALVSSSKTS